MQVLLLLLLRLRLRLSTRTATATPTLRTSRATKHVATGAQLRLDPRPRRLLHLDRLGAAEVD